ncbi:hypothetical protein BDZ89DRAFT_696310 [Hymenopellis radicata]|nr:hypothetical protein BDZ89DRAFT_696310 [Hymenopellis radicata]
MCRPRHLDHRAVCGVSVLVGGVLVLTSGRCTWRRPGTLKPRSSSLAAFASSSWAALCPLPVPNIRPCRCRLGGARRRVVPLVVISVVLVVLVLVVLVRVEVVVGH